MKVKETAATQNSFEQIIDGSLTIESLLQSDSGTLQSDSILAPGMYLTTMAICIFKLRTREHFVNPQDIKCDGGKIYRLNDDGSIPKDNPLWVRLVQKLRIYTFGIATRKELQKTH
jgi:hypothetical protein